MGIVRGICVENTSRTLTDLGLSTGSTLFPANSVIVSTRAPIGYVLINKCPMCTNQGCKTLVPDGRILPAYLCHNLRGRTAELNALGSGTTFKELSTERLKNLTIPLPPLPVQREIVERLERELAEADSLAANFKRIAELADAEFKAELEETFRRVEGERVRLGDVCQLKNGYTPKAEELVEDGDVPYYRISAMNLAGNETMLTVPTGWLSNCRRLFHSGSIVFPKNGGAVYTGKVRVLKFDSVVDLNTGVCSPYPELRSDFLYYWVVSFDMRSTIVEGAIPFVDFEKLGNADFVLPTEDVQCAIVAQLDAAKARCEKLKTSAERGLRASETLRAAILSEAFAP